MIAEITPYATSNISFLLDRKIDLPSILIAARVRIPAATSICVQKGRISRVQGENIQNQKNPVNTIKMYTGFNIR